MGEPEGAGRALIVKRAHISSQGIGENLRRLATELQDSGFSVSAMMIRSINLKRLRERLGFTLEQFALRYGLELDAVQNWEHGRREPDTAVRSYLTVIEREPERTQEALMVPIT